MLNFCREQKAFIYTWALVVIFLVLFLGFIRKPTGMLDMKLAGNQDKIVMATEAPDYIQVYSPETMNVRLYPSDERMNDMKVDKEGKRIFVANKEGWLNIIYPGKLTSGKIRRKLGDVLQGVALSGDEKYLAVGIGSAEDYNTRAVSFYFVSELENRDLRSVYPYAELTIRGDIQAIIANPDPTNNQGYIISSQDDRMTIFDFASGRTVAFVDLRNSPAMFRCRPDGKKGYGSVNARESVVVVDLTKGRERNLGFVKVPSPPYYLAFNADGSRLYAGSRSLPEVYVIDTEKDELTETLKLTNPFLPMHLTAEIIAVSSDEKFLYLIPQYGFLLIYEIKNDGRPLKAVQTRTFPKEPSIMDVIRPGQT